MIKSTPDLNSALRQAIDETIFVLLGQSVLESLYRVLDEKYSVASDELPYRLDTMFQVLENTFGLRGSGTIERAITRSFYWKIGLQLKETEGYKLQDYVEEAKKKLALVD
jgi:hypothetical protein